MKREDYLPISCNGRSITFTPSIGAATAKLLGHHGASIAVNYVSNAQAAQSVVDEIEQDGGTAIAVQADVTNTEQIDRMVQQVNQQWGAIDTVVLNSVGGSTNEVAGRFADLSWDRFDAIVTNQLKANFMIPQMQERKSGCIIAVNSVMSRFF
jgi:3-oxoacyl-[acyl-carrier protein] reductase